MTPKARQSMIALSVSAILDGAGTLEQRLDSVIERLASLPTGERKILVKPLKLKLRRALAARTAVITVADRVFAADSRQQLHSMAMREGALLVEERVDGALLAGYLYQMGDDRTDKSLRGRVVRYST